MELTTRCPACGTTFAASLEQLQLRKGYVRCVGCAYIFDGYEAVVPVSVPEPHVSQGHASAGIQSVPAEGHLTGGAPGLTGVAHGSEDEAWHVSGLAGVTVPPVVRRRAPGLRHISTLDEREPVLRDAADPAGIRARPHTAHVPSTPVVGADTRPRSDFGTDPADDGPVLGEARDLARPSVPEFLVGEAPTSRSGMARVGWLMLILIGAGLALAQAAYVYRMQIAVQWPWTRPWLETACEELGCQVPYARSLQHLSITDSSLRRQPESGREGMQRMVFEALLRNSLNVAQQWPVLWLELTDVSGAVLSRRYLPSDVYLAPATGGRYFAALSERRISVLLDINSEHVSGYQVGLFFP